MDLAAAAAAAVASIRHPGNPGAAPAGSLTEPLDFYSQKLKQLAGGSSSTVSPSPLSPGFSRKPAMTPPSPSSPEDGKPSLFKSYFAFFLILFRCFTILFCRLPHFYLFNLQQKVGKSVTFAGKDSALTVPW